MARRPSVHELITSRKAPPMGHLPGHGVKIEYPGATLFLSAIYPYDIKGKPSDDEVNKQADLVFSHIAAISKDAGFGMDDVVKCTVYLKDLKHWDAVKTSLQKHIIGQNQPAITVLQVAALPHEFEVAADAVLMKRGMSAQEILEEDK